MKIMRINRIKEELKDSLFTAIYLLIWFGIMILIKKLLLADYHIEFSRTTVFIAGALGVSHAIDIFGKVPLFRKSSPPAIFEIISRILIVLIGVFILLILEKSFDARHEYGGFVNAFRNLTSHADIYHVWVNTIAVLGALTFYYLWSLVKKHLGGKNLWDILRAPVPGKDNVN
jgi:hypothetical protein